MAQIPNTASQDQCTQSSLFISQAKGHIKRRGWGPLSILKQIISVQFKTTIIEA